MKKRTARAEASSAQGRSKRGKKIKNGEVPVINDGTYGNYRRLLKILEMYER